MPYNNIIRVQGKQAPNYNNTMKSDTNNKTQRTEKPLNLEHIMRGTNLSTYSVNRTMGIIPQSKQGAQLTALSMLDFEDASQRRGFQFMVQVADKVSRQHVPFIIKRIKSVFLLK